jgi:hypothetical protein
MFPELTSEELAAGLDRVAAAILSEAGVEGPPVDAFAMAGKLGVAVAVDDCQSGRARYVRMSNRRSRTTKAAILLRPEPRLERRHWAVAHEIAEHTAYRVFLELGIDPRETAPNTREQVANHMAGRILLPSAWFSADGAACGWDLIELKTRYSTASHELIARRMLECRPAVIISIFDQQRISWRRSNVPGRAPPLSPEETACWRNVHQRNRPAQTNAGLQIVQGWPVHEDGWMREILRTEVGEMIDDLP